jgi:hypothetical protein
VKGVIASVKGGSYTVDKDGNPILQYPVYDDPWSILRASIMGKSSLPEAQDWVDDGFDSLSAKATAVYQGMLDAGVDDREAYALVDELRSAKKTEDKSVADVRREILKKSNVSAEGKVVAYCAMVASESELAWLERLMDLDPDAQAVLDLAMGMSAANDLTGLDARRARMEAIADSDLTEDQKIVVVESFLGNEWTTEKGNASEYAKFRDSLEIGLTVDEYMELYADGVDMDKFFEYTDSGLSAQEAARTLIAMHGLQPIEGKDRVSGLQKWRAAIDSNESVEDQMAALAVNMTPTQYTKVVVANDYGVEPEAWVKVQEMLPDYDADGNGRYKQDEVTDAVNAIGRSLGLTRDQKAVLWQLISGAASEKNNPYNSKVGKQVIDAVEKLKEESEDDMLSFSDEIARQFAGRA